MGQISDPNSKIKKLARRLRAAAACRQELTDRDVEQFVVVVGLSRVWKTYERLTASPRAAAPGE
jgi:hypothetical protein